MRSIVIAVVALLLVASGFSAGYLFNARHAEIEELHERLFVARDTAAKRQAEINILAQRRDKLTSMLRTTEERLKRERDYVSFLHRNRCVIPRAGDETGITLY